MRKHVAYLPCVTCWYTLQQTDAEREAEDFKDDQERAARARETLNKRVCLISSAELTSSAVRCGSDHLDAALLCGVQLDAMLDKLQKRIEQVDVEIGDKLQVMDKDKVCSRCNRTARNAG